MLLDLWLFVGALFPQRCPRFTRPMSSALHGKQRFFERDTAPAMSEENVEIVLRMNDAFKRGDWVQLQFDLRLGEGVVVGTVLTRDHDPGAGQRHRLDVLGLPAPGLDRTGRGPCRRRRTALARCAQRAGNGRDWLRSREPPRDHRAICEPTITVFSLGSWKASTGLVAFRAIAMNSFLRQGLIGGASVGLIAIRETK